MSFDLILRGGTVALPDTNGVAADIAIKDEHIAACTMRNPQRVPVRQTAHARSSEESSQVCGGHGSAIARRPLTERRHGALRRSAGQAAWMPWRSLCPHS